MRSRKFWLLALQAAISILLLSYLGYQAWQDATFAHLINAPKDPTQLALAGFVALAAVTITLSRWWVLTQALQMPLSLREALRIGFVAYFLNLLGVGVVGGDALKAIYLGRRTPGRRAEALTTIVIDRVLGLYVLVLLAAGGIAVIQFDSDSEAGATVAHIGEMAQFCALLGTLGLGLLFLPGLADAKFWDRLSKLPVVGGILRQLVSAARIYRSKAGHVAAAIAMSVVVHSLYVLMFYLIAGGLSMERPSLAAHFVIVPASMAAGTLPIGTQEAVMDLLYRAALSTAGRQGFVLTLAYRVIQILVSGFGIVFYLAGKREVDHLLERPQGAAGEPLPAANSVKDESLISSQSRSSA